MAFDPEDGGAGGDRPGCGARDDTRLLLVEDRRGGMDELAEVLRRQEGLRIVGASDSGLLAGVRALFDPPDAVLVAADLVGFTAWDTTRLIKQLCPHVCVIVVGSGAAPRWLRQKEAPDAVVAEPSQPTAVATLLRVLHTRKCRQAPAGTFGPARPDSLDSR